MRYVFTDVCLYSYKVILYLFSHLWWRRSGVGNCARCTDKILNCCMSLVHFLPYVFWSWIWIFYMLRLKCLEKGMSMDMYFWLIRWLADIFYLHFLFSFIFSTFFLKIRNDKKRGKIFIIKNGHKKDGEFVY